MATATTTKPKAPRKSKAPSVCQLVLFIEGVSYHVKPIDPGFHHRAFQLRKTDNTVYHISEGENGAACDCPSGCWRPDTPCRHLRALAACTLIGPLSGPEPAKPQSRPGVDRVRDEFDD
jgi:hypothetical protein